MSALVEENDDKLDSNKDQCIAVEKEVPNNNSIPIITDDSMESKAVALQIPLQSLSIKPSIPSDGISAPSDTDVTTSTKPSDVQNNNNNNNNNNANSDEMIFCAPVTVIKKPKRTDDEIFSTPNRHVWRGGKCPCCD